MDDGPWIDCWQCAGEGVIYSCFEEYACVDPESGCDECESRCDICRGKGGWPLYGDATCTQPEREGGAG